MRGASSQLLEHCGIDAVACRMVDHGERRLDGAETLDHALRRIVVQGNGCSRERRGDAHDELVEHDPQLRRLGAAGIAIAQRRRQRPHGVHQLGHVRRVGGQLPESMHGRIDRLWQIGQERQLDDLGGLGQAVGRRCPFDEHRRRRGGDGGAMTGLLDDAHGQLWIPGDAPGLAERPARAATFFDDAPRDVEGNEAVQQVGTAPTVRGTDVQLDRPEHRLGFEASGALGRREVAGQRDLRRLGGHLANGVSDDQLVTHDLEASEDTVGSVQHLGQTRAGSVAKCRQGRGNAGGGDQMVGRRRHAFGPQRPGRVDEEAGHALRTGMAEHVVIPARADDTGAVARDPSQPAMRPGDPRDRHFGSRLTPKHGGVVALHGDVWVEGRDVPRSAHHRHHGTPFEGAADLLTHVRLATHVVATRRDAGTHGAHGVGHRIKHWFAVTAVLDEVVPPPFRIGIATGRRQLGEWVNRRPSPGQRSVGERDGQWEVDGAQLDAASRRPRCGLPLGAERREWSEHGTFGLGHDVAEEGHGRDQPFVADPGQRLLGIDRRLDEHEVWRKVVESPPHGAGGAGTVVADPKEVQTVVDVPRLASARRYRPEAGSLSRAGRLRLPARTLR